MKLRRPPALVLMVVGLIVLAATLAMWMSQGRTWTFSDGSRLTLVSIQAGTNLAHYAGNRLQRWAAHLPGPIGKHFRGRMFLYPTPGNTNFAFTFEYRGTRSFDHQSFLFRVRDAEGVVADPHLAINPFAIATNAYSLFCMGARLPRGSEEITLLIYDNKPREPVLLGELRLPNPLYHATSPAPLEPRPIVRRSPEFSVSLLEARLGTDLGWRDYDGRLPFEAVGQLRFKLSDGEQSARDWAILDVRYQDAGRRRLVSWQFNAKDGESRTVELMGEWPPYLWPGRTTVEMKTAWIRTTPPSPDHVHTIRGLNLKTARGAVTIEYSTNLSMGSLKLMTLGPGIGSFRFLGAFLYDPPGAGFGTNAYGAYLHSLTASTGERLKRLDASRFEIPPSATNLEVTVYINPVRRFDFQFQPDLTYTNLPAR